LPKGEAKELVAGWSADDSKPRGAPVGLAIAADGSVWGVEDKNKTVFRIARDKYQARAWSLSENADAQSQDAVFAKLHKEIFLPRCAACHSEFSGSATESLGKLKSARWVGLNASIDFYGRLTAEPPRRMPPAGKLSESEIGLVRAWLDR